jgi:hypothetical protein
LHNSNKELVQVTLLGEALEEEDFHLLGFVKGEFIEMQKVAGLRF